MSRSLRCGAVQILLRRIAPSTGMLHVVALALWCGANFDGHAVQTLLRHREPSARMLRVRCAGAVARCKSSCGVL